MKHFGRLFIFLLVLLCLLSLGYAEPICNNAPPSRQQAEIVPWYNHTSDIRARLSFSDGKANCYGTITPIDSVNVTLTVTLYEKNGGNWNYVQSWSSSSTGGVPATASGSVAVERGTYKLITSGNVGGLEYPKAVVEKTY